MPSKVKSKTRASKTSAAPSSRTQTKAAIDPPEPFTRPANLVEFLPKLSKQHVYITHIDTKPRDFKWKIFLVPLFMNIVVVAGIIWRIKTVGPFYMQICYTMMGLKNEMSIDTVNTPMNELVKIILSRTMVFVVDLLIYVFIWPWPREFFTGRKIGNPIAWRIGVGFRDKEIIVRRSRKWDRDVRNVLEEDSEGTQLFNNTVRQAVDPVWMFEKTGYLMLNKDWDLDWKAMVQATKLVDKKKMNLDDFKTTILVYHPDFEWMTIESPSVNESAKEKEARDKIVAFKEELTAMGKDNVFFRWIELVQYESSQPGGYGPEQREKTLIKARALFESQKIDFDKFWDRLGGMTGMPGFDEL